MVRATAVRAAAMRGATAVRGAAAVREAVVLVGDGVEWQWELMVKDGPSAAG